MFNNKYATAFENDMLHQRHWLANNSVKYVSAQPYLGSNFHRGEYVNYAPVGNVNCSLWRPNILPLFNLGWWYLWWLQHSVAAVLLFSKQPDNKILFDLALRKCYVATLQKVYRGKCLIFLNVATA